MANVIPNTFLQRIMNGSIDLDTDTIKVMLLTSSHTNNIDTQEFISDVSANQVSGTGYTAGGATLTGKSVTVNHTTDRGVFDANDVTWPNATITARYAVLYKDTGTPSTSPIIQIFDFGTDKSSTAGDFSLQWSANGILTAAQA
jgi:hypothetical protein